MRDKALFQISNETEKGIESYEIRNSHSSLSSTLENDKNLS